MKTFLFCTAYLSNPDKWRNRYRRWLALHRQIPKSFTGDRYAEYRDEIPADADYAAQVLPAMTIRYRP